MVETTAPLVVGEVIRFELPVAGFVEARIIWKRESKHGCEFLTPLSKAALSAALLRADIPAPHVDNALRIEELPVGISPSVEDLAAWQSEFEKTKGAMGYQLFGFRQTSEGLVIALVAKTN